MKVKLLVNLKVDDGRVMLAGTYENKESSFPPKLQREIQMHRDGTRPRKTLEIVQEDKPAAPKKKKSSTRKKSTTT